MQTSGRATLGDTVIDFDRMEIRSSGQSIAATSLEFRLLKFFIDNPYRVLSREELIRAVWTQRKRSSLRAVDNCISNLRRKVEKHPLGPRFFQTVHGKGYQFVPLGLAATGSGKL